MTGGHTIPEVAATIRGRHRPPPGSAPTLWNVHQVAPGEGSPSDRTTVTVCLVLLLGSLGFA